ncbi:MAG: ATP-binding cassette domain-containing protein [Lachnospiraceae bacterium]|nr:ATP-binding cassette domain-containing protein [Lachnospiraceae bacterium]
MRITDLEKKQGDFQMKIDTLVLEKGKIHGIIGGNGCGKTTLCKLIMGILRPDRGTLDYEGLDIRKITMTAQRPNFIQGSVYENIC